MKESPFKPGVIEPDEKTFFGREKESKVLWKEIQNSKVTLIWGPRRMGKSWFIKYFLEFKLSTKYFPIFISFSDLNLRTKETIFKQLSNLLFHAISGNLLNIDMGNLEDTIPDPSEESKLDNFHQFNSYFQKINVFLKNRNIVLAIDEFDEIDRFIQKGKIDEFFINNLCSWAEKIRNFNLILVGGVYLDQIRRSELYGALRKCTLIPITLLNKEQAFKLIKEPFKENGIQISDQIANEIFLYTGGQPQLLQQVCDILFEKLVEDNKIEISINDLNYIIISTLDNSTIQGIKIEDWTQTYFTILWDGIKGDKTLLDINPKNIVLSSSADLLSIRTFISIEDLKNHLEENNVKIVDLEKHLDFLVRYSILLEEKKMEYSFPIKLFRLWINKNYTFEIEKTKMADDSKEKKIETELKEYFSNEYWNLIPQIIQDQIKSAEIDYLSLDEGKDPVSGKFYSALIETLVRDLIFKKIRSINNDIIFNKKFFMHHIRPNQVIDFFNNKTNQLNFDVSSTIILNNPYLKEFFGGIPFPEDREYFTDDSPLEKYLPSKTVKELYNKEFIENVKAEYWDDLFDLIDNHIWSESFQNMTYIFRKIRNWVIHDVKNVLNRKSIDIIHQVLFYSTKGTQPRNIIRNGKYIKRVFSLSSEIDKLKGKGERLNLILKHIPDEGINFIELHDSLTKDPNFEEVRDKLKLRKTKKLGMEQIIRDFLKENLDYLVNKKAVIIKKTEEGQLYFKNLLL